MELHEVTVPMSIKVSKQLKRPGGKYLKVELEVIGDRIVKLKISGDFFAYPSHLLDMLEKEAAGLRAEKEGVERLLETYKGRLELVGVRFEDLKRLILEALEETISM